MYIEFGVTMAQVAQIEMLINSTQKLIRRDVIFKVKRVNSRFCPLSSYHYAV